MGEHRVRVRQRLRGGEREQGRIHRHRIRNSSRVIGAELALRLHYQQHYRLEPGREVGMVQEDQGGMVGGA